MKERTTAMPMSSSSPACCQREATMAIATRTRAAATSPRLMSIVEVTRSAPRRPRQHHPLLLADRELARVPPLELRVQSRQLDAAPCVEAVAGQPGPVGDVV